MSELTVGSLSGLAANSYVVDVAAGSTLDLSNATDLPASALPAGSILQLVQVVKNNQYSVSLAASTMDIQNVPDYEVTITPSSTSNKVLIVANIGQLTSVSNVQLFRDGSIVTGSIGDANGSRTRSTIASTFGGQNTIYYLDSPATTSATTYGVRIGNQEASTTTVYFNGYPTDGARIPSAASTITAMEVSA